MSSPYIVRLFPSPTAESQIRVERLTLPTLLTLSDLSSAATLPLLESQIVSTLIPLIKEQIAGSAIASPSLNVNLIEKAAQRVRETLPSTPNPAARVGVVRTQPGY